MDMSVGKNMYLRERIALPSGVCAYAGNSPGKGVFHFLPLVSYFPGFRVQRFIEITSPPVARESARAPEKNVLIISLYLWNDSTDQTEI